MSGTLRQKRYKQAQRGECDLTPGLPRTARFGEIDATAKYAQALGRG